MKEELKAMIHVLQIKDIISIVHTGIFINNVETNESVKQLQTFALTYIY